MGWLVGEKGGKDEPEISEVPTAWRDPHGSQGRRSVGVWGALGREEDTACTATSLVLMRKEHVVFVDERGRDEEVDFEQIFL